MLKKQLLFWVYALLICPMVLLSLVLISEIVILNFKQDYIWQGENTRFDPSLGWAPAESHLFVDENGVSSSTNSLGFRGEEVDKSLDHIIIMGDSVAWGYNLNDNETITHYLEDQLSDKPQYQVLNLGVTGYGIDQYYLYLKKNIAFTNPKYIFVIIYVGNDRMDTVQNVRHGKSKPLLRIIDNEIVNTNANISKVSCFNLISKSIFLRRITLLQNVSDQLCRQETLSELDADQLIMRLLIEIQRLSNESESKTIFILSPKFNNSTNSLDNTSLSHQYLYFKDILHTLNYSFIDLQKNLEDINLSEQFQDSAHYTAEGSRLVAGLIYEKIEEIELE